MDARWPWIAPSVLSADFARLGEEVATLEGADLLHVDVMDGHFVPNLTLGPGIVAALRRTTSLPLDVHLMIDAPERYLEEFAAAGAAYLTVHAEACTHLHRTLQRIRDLGVKAGVALNPATSPEALRYVLDQADLILVMTVNPGFGGQSFLEGLLPKVSEVAQLCRTRSSGPLLEIDGGVTPAIGRRLVEAGAQILVAGSAVFGTHDRAGAIRQLKGL